MNDKIFPQEIIDNCYEKTIKDFSITTKAIYLIVLSACLIVFFSSFFINVDVSLRAQGVVKPLGEQLIILSPRDGILMSKQFKLGDQVNKGDSLCVVWSKNIEASLTNMFCRKEEISNQLHDITLLLNKKSSSHLRTNKYRTDLMTYESNLNSLSAECDKRYRDYERAKNLFVKGFISANDFEEAEEKYEQSLYRKKQEQLKFSNKWLGEKEDLTIELRQINNGISAIQIQKEEAHIICPSKGSIIQVFNIKEGVFVKEGQQLLTVSPDDKLFAECYVQPKDIGLIRCGMPVRITVDAFNYNQWGILRGTVQIISQDVITTEKGTFFRVICAIPKQHLELKNGIRGRLKKGMTLRARMVISRRTIFQLLYDQIDDWLNPSI